MEMSKSCQQFNFEGLVSFEEVTDYKIRNENTACKDIAKNKKSKKLGNKPYSKTKNVADNRGQKRKVLVTDDEEGNSQENLLRVKSPDMTAWDPFHIPEEIIRAMSMVGYSRPTDIQAACLPDAMLKRRDILGAAETGSGKTLAFTIPIISGILASTRGNEIQNDKLWCLMVAPTRELAIQVKNHVLDVCSFTNIKVLEIVGGLFEEKQNRKLNKIHPHIVVGTPGRLWQLIRQGNEHLSQISNIRYLVIDEADRMVEKAHFEELRSLLELIKGGEGKRQTFVFSATLTLVHAAPSYRKNKGHCLKVTPGQKLEALMDVVGICNPSIVDITKPNVLADGISEKVIRCENPEQKDEYLYYLLKTLPGRKIVFSNSVTCVKRLASLFNILECEARPIFSDMVQKQRLKNFERFQNSNSAVLLATDVAARGLDVKGVNYVIHYQIPQTSEGYVHRSGRCGRGNESGTSVIIYTPSEHRFYEKIKETLAKNTQIEPFEVKPELLKVAKRAVAIAVQMEKLQNKMKRWRANANWIEKCARQMDMIIDEDQIPGDKMNAEELREHKLALKRLGVELKSAMNAMRGTVLSKGICQKYPSYQQTGVEGRGGKGARGLRGWGNGKSQIHNERSRVANFKPRLTELLTLKAPKLKCLNLANGFKFRTWTTIRDKPTCLLRRLVLGLHYKETNETECLKPFPPIKVYGIKSRRVKLTGEMNGKVTVHYSNPPTVINEDLTGFEELLRDYKLPDGFYKNQRDSLTNKYIDPKKYFFFFDSS